MVSRLPGRMTTGRTYAVAVCMAACYSIRLVEQAVTYFARKVRAEADQVGPQGF
jgi:hypothetical protein